MSQHHSAILADRSADPFLAARSLRDLALQAPDPAEILEELAATAVDSGLELRTRVVALQAAAMTAHQGALPIPNDAVEAVDDLRLVDWAIRNDQIAALTGVFALAAKNSDALTAGRKLVGRKLLANGHRGPEVTAMLLDAGDLEAAARAAADDFMQNIAPLPDGDLGALTWTRIAVEWLGSGMERVFVLLCRELNQNQGAAERFATLLRDVPHVAPEMMSAAEEVLLQREDG